MPANMTGEQFLAYVSIAIAAVLALLAAGFAIEAFIWEPIASWRQTRRAAKLRNQSR